MFSILVGIINAQESSDDGLGCKEVFPFAIYDEVGEWYSDEWSCSGTLKSPDTPSMDYRSQPMDYRTEAVVYRILPSPFSKIPSYRKSNPPETYAHGSLEEEISVYYYTDQKYRDGEDTASRFYNNTDFGLYTLYSPYSNPPWSWVTDSQNPGFSKSIKLGTNCIVRVGLTVQPQTADPYERSWIRSYPYHFKTTEEALSTFEIIKPEIRDRADTYLARITGNSNLTGFCSNNYTEYRLNITKGWIQPVQTVFQDDPIFMKYPENQNLLEGESRSFKANIPMVKGKSTVLFGDNENRMNIGMKGIGYGSENVPVKLKIRLDNGLDIKEIYISEKVFNIPIGGNRREGTPFNINVGVDEIDYKSFTFDNLGSYKLTMELVDSNNIKVNNSDVIVFGTVVETFFPKTLIVPIMIEEEGQLLTLSEIDTLNGQLESLYEDIRGIFTDLYPVTIDKVNSQIEITSQVNRTVIQTKEEYVQSRIDSLPFDISGYSEHAIQSLKEGYGQDYDKNFGYFDRIEGRGLVFKSIDGSRNERKAILENTLSLLYPKHQKFILLFDERGYEKFEGNPAKVRGFANGKFAYVLTSSSTSGTINRIAIHEQTHNIPYKDKNGINHNTFAEEEMIDLCGAQYHNYGYSDPNPIGRRSQLPNWIGRYKIANGYTATYRGVIRSLFYPGLEKFGLTNETGAYSIMEGTDIQGWILGFDDYLDNEYITQFIDQCTYRHLITELQDGEKYAFDSSKKQDSYFVMGIIRRGKESASAELLPVGVIDTFPDVSEEKSTGWRIALKDSNGGIVSLFNFEPRFERSFEEEGPKIFKILPDVTEGYKTISFDFRIPVESKEKVTKICIETLENINSGYRELDCTLLDYHEFTDDDIFLVKGGTINLLAEMLADQLPEAIEQSGEREIVISKLKLNVRDLESEDLSEFTIGKSIFNSKKEDSKDKKRLSKLNFEVQTFSGDIIGNYFFEETKEGSDDFVYNGEPIQIPESLKHGDKIYFFLVIGKEKYRIGETQVVDSHILDYTIDSLFNENVQKINEITGNFLTSLPKNINIELHHTDRIYNRKTISMDSHGKNTIMLNDVISFIKYKVFSHGVFVNDTLNITFYDSNNQILKTLQINNLGCRAEEVCPQGDFVPVDISNVKSVEINYLGDSPVYYNQNAEITFYTGKESSAEKPDYFQLTIEDNNIISASSLRYWYNSPDQTIITTYNVLNEINEKAKEQPEQLPYLISNAINNEQILIIGGEGIKNKISATLTGVATKLFITVNNIIPNEFDISAGEEKYVQFIGKELLLKAILYDGKIVRFVIDENYYDNDDPVGIIVDKNGVSNGYCIHNPNKFPEGYQKSISTVVGCQQLKTKPVMIVNVNSYPPSEVFEMGFENNDRDTSDKINKWKWDNTDSSFDDGGIII